MARADRIVSVTIDASNNLPTSGDFGTPLVLAPTDGVIAVGEVREYRSAAELVSDGIASTTPAYKMAAAVFQQSPNVGVVKVSDTGDSAQSLELTVLDATEGNVIALTVTSPAGVEYEISYTIGAAATTTTVATAVAALIDAISGLSASSSVAVISVDVDVVNERWGFSGFTGDGRLSYEELTAPGTADYSDLLDTLVARPSTSDWYAVLIDRMDATTVADVAAWAETNKRLFCAMSCDTELLSGTGLGATLFGLGYLNTHLQYHENPAERIDAATAGRELAYKVGESAWAYKRLSGITPDDFLTETQVSALEDDQVNYYYTAKGSRVTRQGYSSGDWIDTARGLHALESDMQTAVLTWLVTKPKRAYTDREVAGLAEVLRNVLDKYVRQEFLDGGNGEDPTSETYIAPPQVVVPKVATIPAATRATRVLPDVTFSARLAGAINGITISGSVAV